MIINRRISESGASALQIADLERMIGSKLPTDYRDFMISENGGRPCPSAFEGPSGDGSEVHYFLTLDPKAQHYNIIDKMNGCKNRIPAGLIPIATDDFGNLVLLDIGGRSFGSVLFWDHENENPDGDPWWDNISFIASTFYEFTSGLH